MNAVFKVLWAHKVSLPLALLELMVLPVRLGTRLLVGGDLRDLRAPVDHKVKRGQQDSQGHEASEAQQDPKETQGHQLQDNLAHRAFPPPT